MVGQQEEINQLRRKIAELEEENYILKKCVGLLRETSKVKATDFCLLMEQDDRCAKTKWTEQLGVSTSGYYDWIKDREQRRLREQSLAERLSLSLTIATESMAQSESAAYSGAKGKAPPIR